MFEEEEEASDEVASNLVECLIWGEMKPLDRWIMIDNTTATVQRE